MKNATRITTALLGAFAALTLWAVPAHADEHPAAPPAPSFYQPICSGPATGIVTIPSDPGYYYSVQDADGIISSASGHYALPLGDVTVTAYVVGGHDVAGTFYDYMAEPSGCPVAAQPRVQIPGKCGTWQARLAVAPVETWQAAPRSDFTVSVDGRMMWDVPLNAGRTAVVSAPFRWHSGPHKVQVYDGGYLIASRTFRCGS